MIFSLKYASLFYPPDNFAVRTGHLISADMQDNGTTPSMSVVSFFIV